MVGFLLGLAAVTVALAVLADADGAGHPVTIASVVVAVAVSSAAPPSWRRSAGGRERHGGA